MLPESFSGDLLAACDMVREDQRFQTANNRIFRPLRKDKFKVKLDDRFQSVLSDERFNSVVSSDGRKLKKSEHLKNLYSKNDEPSSSQAPRPRQEDRLNYLTQLARGEISGESSSEEDQSIGGSEESEESEDEESDMGPASEEPEPSTSAVQIPGDEDVPVGEATARLAILNCDWTNIRAVDLLVVLQSFCPAGTALKSVRIYPSDFGLKAMEIENKYGPQGIWNESLEREDGEVYDDLEVTEEAHADFRRKSGKAGVVYHEELCARGLAKDDDQDTETSLNTGVSGFNQEALRRYELAKLKYYFAVVECDGVETASILYERMDGIEFEHSSVAFDLRFIPDDISFEDRAVKDECLGGDAEAIVAKYTPPDFVVKALQHTNVECTWDQEERQRSTILKNFSKWRTLQDSDFQQYLASDESSDEDEETVRNKRNALLGDDQEVEDDDFFAPEPEDESEGVDRVMTYMPALEEEMKTKVTARAQDEETPFEAQQRKFAEARKKKKALKKIKASEEAESEVKADPKLQLKFDEQDEDGDGYDLREIEKAEKSKRKKKRFIPTIRRHFLNIALGSQRRRWIRLPSTWRIIAFLVSWRETAALESIRPPRNSAPLQQ